MSVEHAPKRLLYTFGDAARELGCSRWSVYRLIDSGELEAVPFGANARRITGESLHRLARTGVRKIRDTSRDANEGRTCAA